MQADVMSAAGCFGNEGLDISILPNLIALIDDNHFA